jgi:pimeloyl-ACP methyl ester carboxylesterase
MKSNLKVITHIFPHKSFGVRKIVFLPVSLANRFGTDNVHILESTGHWPMLEQAKIVHELILKNIAKAD